MNRKGAFVFSLIIFSLIISILSVNFVSSQTQADYTKYYIYATHNDYTGNLSGRYGADAICNIEVPIFETERPTTGVYKAYISTNGEYPGAILGMNTTRPIYNLNNQVVANNLADLEDGVLSNPIWAKTEGNFVPIWVGIGRSDLNCNGWNSESPSVMGGEGLIGLDYLLEKSGQWSIFGNDYCYREKRLYCIGPFEGAVNNYCGDGACDRVYEDCVTCPSDCGLCNTGVYYMFTTQNQYSGNLNGTYGANQKCNTDPRKPAVGIYKAFISTNNGYAFPESMYTHWKFFSLDTLLKIADNYDDLIDGEILNPVYPIDLYARIWTGTSTGSACNGWTSNSSSLKANYGYPVFTTLSWWNNGEDSCSEKRSLYCIGPFYEGTYCGDGFMSEGEVCDDGLNNGLYGYCNEFCSGSSAYCGDGFCNSGETCSSCTVDCGGCNTGGGGSSGGGGGGSSGGSSHSSSSSGSTTPVYKGKNYTFSTSETQTGKTIELKEKDIVHFSLSSEGNEEEHIITITDVQSDYITVKIQSETIIDTIHINETRKYDITEDNYYDLQLTLNSIEKGEADLEIKTIDEKIKHDSTIGDFVKASWQRTIIILIAIVCLIAIIFLKGLKRKKE